MYTVSVCTAIFAKNSWKSLNNLGYPVLSVVCRKVEPVAFYSTNIGGNGRGGMDGDLLLAESRRCFSKDRPSEDQNVVLGLFSRSYGHYQKTRVKKLIILITFIASSRKLIPDTVSVFIFNTFSSVYTYETHISCLIHQRFPGTQERNAHLLGPAPASKMKMKYQLTLIQHPAISSMRFSSLAHKAAVHCGAVTLVGSVRTRDL